MIKNCIIFRYSDEYTKIQKLNINGLSDIDLEKCLATASGFTKRKIDGFLKLVRNEELSLKEETKSHYVMNYSCEFRAPKLTAAGEPPPFVSVNFRIWLRKNSPFVISTNGIVMKVITSHKKHSNKTIIKNSFLFII